MGFTSGGYMQRGLGRAQSTWLERAVSVEVIAIKLRGGWQLGGVKRCGRQQDEQEKQSQKPQVPRSDPRPDRGRRGKRDQHLGHSVPAEHTTFGGPLGERSLHMSKGPMQTHTLTPSPSTRGSLE